MSLRDKEARGFEPISGSAPGPASGELMAGGNGSFTT
jgi:hypothetical protein